MKPLALLLLAALYALGCSSTDSYRIGYFDGINCYDPQPIPAGALVYECFVCACASEAPIEVLLAASNDAEANACWVAVLTRTGGIGVATQYGCTWTGGHYSPDPGGKPNAMTEERVRELRSGEAE